MSKRRTIVFWILVIGVIGIWGCKSNRTEEPEGGFCAYDTMLVRARVASVFEAGQNTWDAILVLEGSRKEYTSEDTVWLSSHLGHYANMREVDSLKLKPGVAYKYIIRNIREGHCTDHLEDLSFELY